MTSVTVPSFTRSSRMYAITGLPAILSIGLGVMCVCGRSRVPFPASGMMTFMQPSIWSRWSRRARSLAPVTVLDAHDVVEMRCRHLENVAVGDGFHLVHRARRHVVRLPDRKL